MKNCGYPFINLLVIQKYVYSFLNFHQKWNRVKCPLLARFLDNLTETTCVRERVVEFFFTEAVNTVV